MGGKNAKKSQQTGLDPSYVNPFNFCGIMSPFEVIKTLAGVGALGPFGGLVGGLGGCSPFGAGCSPYNNLGCSPFNGLGCAPFNNLGCGPFNGLGCNPFGGLGLGGLAPLAMPFGHFGGLPNLNGLGCAPFGNGFNGFSGAPFGAGCPPFNNLGCGPFNGLGCLPSLPGCAPGLGVGAPCNGIVPFRGSIAPLAMPWTNGPGCGFPAGFPGLLC